MNNPKILSPAMLKTYQSCKKKYFLHYVRNIIMPQSATIFEQGKNIHALAGYYLDGINVEKFEKALNEKEKDIWIKLKNNEYFNFSPTQLIKYHKKQFGIFFDFKPIDEVSVDIEKNLCIMYSGPDFTTIPDNCRIRQ